MENSDLSVSDMDVVDQPTAKPNEKKSTKNTKPIDLESIDIKCKCKTNLKSNAFVTHLMHSMDNQERKKSTNPSDRICCEKRMKCCRPNNNEMIHNLKQSHLWLNDENKTKNMSHKLIDDNILEWLKGVLNCECLPVDDREPNDNQIYCCDQYKLNGSLSFEMMKNIIETMQLTKVTANKKPEQIPTHVNILILGAGLAGIGAATAIFNYSKRKFTYKILEAQNEAGGRVKSVYLKKMYANKKCEASINEDRHQKSMDAGAQWLHGRYNPLYTIAKKYDLLTVDQSEEGLGAYLYEGGRQIDEFFVQKIDFQIGKILKKCEKFAKTSTKMRTLKSNTKIKTHIHPNSVGHFLREHFRTFLSNQIDNQNDIKLAWNLFEWHKRFQIIDNSCLSLDQLSAKLWGKYSFNGEMCQAHYNFENGFASCIDAILNELIDAGNNDCIHFNKHVIEIRINDTNCNRRPFKLAQLIENDVKNSENSENLENLANISVKCADGSSYTADHVLVTFPLGILKKYHQQLFRPALPQQMQLAIDSLGYETINKIFLEFNAPWWKDLNGMQFIYEDNCEERHEDNENKHWTRYLTGFDVLRPNQPNVLLGWVGGVGAIDMETLSDAKIIDDCIQLLSRFTNIDVPFPTRYFCTRWHSNPFINGSYSYISTNCDENETITKNWLNQKLTINDFYPMSSVAHDKSTDDDGNDNDDDDFLIFAGDTSNELPIVLFAGEACHEKYFSTAHGAYLSGMEQVQKFLNEYN